MSSTLETIERAIVFENASGPRRISAEQCVSECISQFDYALLQLDLGLNAGTRALYVILRFREDRFTDTSHARIVALGEEAEARVVALSELEYQERGHFLTGFNACTKQLLGLPPDEVPAALETLLAEPAAPERRASPRLQVQAPAVVTIGAQKFEGTVENLSRGGALVKTSSPPVLQEKVELEVRLPGGPVHRQATVVNLSPRGAGLQFTEALPAVKLEALPPAKPAVLPAPVVEAATAEAKTLERVGPYELLSLLGQGGAGEVHFAVVIDGPRKGEHVALKRLHKRRAHEPEAIRQLEAEARVLSVLKHPNIVRSLDSGVFEGQPFLVMEAIDGRDLAQVLRRSRTRKKPLPVDVACSIVKTLLDALSAVHGARDEGALLGLVHGDVAPHNLYVSKTGALKLGDFGMAKRAGKGGAHRVEQGRPTYLSPEMLDGDLSPAADLWAAAVMLYELLTLVQPFSGNDLDELTHAIRHTRERPVRELRDDCSGPLEAVLKTALEKDPARRFQTAKDFADALAPHYHLVRAPLQLPKVIAGLFST